MATVFTADDLARLPELISADLAPDGRTTVYAATTADGTHTLERPQLWLHTPDSDPQALSPSDDAQNAPTFSPDGTRIAFVQDVDGYGQISVLTLRDRTVRVLTDFPRGATDPRWSPDGSQLAFAGNDAPLRDPRRPYRVTRPVWRRDGMGLVDDVATELWTVPADGGIPTRLTDHGGIVASVQWAPDGRRLLYDCTAEPDTSAVALRTVTTDGSVVAEVMTGDYLVYPPMAAWLSDGRIVRTTAWNVHNQLDLVVHDPATGADTELHSPLAGQIGGLMVFGMNSALMQPRLLVDDNDDVLLYVQTGGRTELHRIATADGADTTLWTGNACVAPVARTGDTVLLARTTFSEPAALVLLDLARGEEQALDVLDRGWLTDLPFTVHELGFRGADGTPVEGWYLEPTVGEEPYATVLHVHGGPFAAHGYGFSIDDHLLTSAGYGVLKVNFRGSSGYGEDFSASLVGDWGHHDAGDCLAGLDHVVETGLADPDRLGSFGLSGGGFMTSWLLTHSDRFAAGIAECPVTDWSGMVGSDIPQVVGRWLGHGPGEGPAQMAEYARTSPVTYAADCTTPMLVIEHESDLRCPVGQGDVLYNALQLNGCPTEMLRLPGMSHVDVYGVADLHGRTERLAALADWFDRYLTA